jgi:hypothetical protein
MQRPWFRLLVLAALAVGVGWLLLVLLDAGQDEPTPAPVVPPSPAPEPKPQPKPKPRPCPGPGPCPSPREGEPVVTARVGGRVSPDGREEVHLDLPGQFHLRNRGGSDGSGLCVFCSLAHSGTWSEDPVLKGIFEWMFTRPGGGYPAKVDRMIEARCQETSLPRPAYLQIEGDDLEPLQLACQRSLMPAVTYNYSPTGRYGGQRVAHMVSLVHASPAWFAVLDNNYPPEDRNDPQNFEWMDLGTFRSVYTGGRSGWAIIPLKDGPPPIPRN